MGAFSLIVVINLLNRCGMCDAYECDQNDRTANSLNGSIESLTLSQASGKSDRRKTVFDDTRCKKCQSPNPVVKVHAQGSHCRDCFLTYANHKFRSTIGKEGIMPYGATVVLAYSGGPSSTAMVKLLSDSLRETKKKANLNFKVKCVHVELSSSPFSLSNKHRDNSVKNTEVLNKMESFCRISGFEFESINAATWFKTNARISFETFMNIKDQTLKIDRENQIVRKILTDFCSEQNFDWLMLGQCLFRSSVNALTQVSLGRGIDLGSICKFADRRLSDSVTIIYPMKEFTRKEVAFFNQFQKLETFKFSELETASDVNSSIQRLTENFLLNLQTEFPAAVPNARNSAEKVLPRNIDQNSLDENCPLCLMRYEKSPNNGKTNSDNARTAAEFSRLICSNDSSNANDCSDILNVNKFCGFCCSDDPFDEN